jgi:hypothetical protein
LISEKIIFTRQRDGQTPKRHRWVLVAGDVAMLFRTPGCEHPSEYAGKATDSKGRAEEAPDVAQHLTGTQLFF